MRHEAPSSVKSSTLQPYLPRASAFMDSANGGKRLIGKRDASNAAVTTGIIGPDCVGGCGVACDVATVSRSTARPLIYRSRKISIRVDRQADGELLAVVGDWQRVIQLQRCVRE